MWIRQIRVTVLSFLFLSAVVVFGQQRSPIDLVLVLDTSAAMSGYYHRINQYLTGSLLRDNLRLGDTFHLIAFSDKPRVEIARRIEGQGDLETIIGRMLLMYPLEPEADIPAALLFAESYTLGLGSPRQKKIVVLSLGEQADAASFRRILDESRSRLRGNPISLEYKNPADLPSAPAPAQASRPAAPTGSTAPVTPPATPAPATRPAAPASQTPAAPAQASRPTAPASSAAPVTPPTTPAPTTRPVAPASQTPAAPTQASRPSTPVTPPATPAPATRPAAPANQTPPAQAPRPTAPTTQPTAPAGSADPVPPRPATPPAPQEARTPERPARVERPPRGEGEKAALFIIPGLLGLALLGLGVFLVVRRLHTSPNRAVAMASRGRSPAGGRNSSGQAVGSAGNQQNRMEKSPLARPESAEPPGRDPVESYRRPRRESPYTDSYRPPKDVEYGSPLMLKLFVVDQTTFIGKRNTHLVKPGLTYTVGGGRSDFLIFLVPVPSHIGEFRYESSGCTFYPRKPGYFPDIGNNPVPHCIGKTIRVISDKGYELFIRIEQYEDPLVELNKLMRSIRVPSALEV